MLAPSVSVIQTRSTPSADGVKVNVCVELPELNESEAGRNVPPLSECCVTVSAPERLLAATMKFVDAVPVRPLYGPENASAFVAGGVA